MTTSSRGRLVTDPLGFLADEIEQLKRENLYRPLRVLSSPQAAEAVVDGHG